MEIHEPARTGDGNTVSKTLASDSRRTSSVRVRRSPAAVRAGRWVVAVAQASKKLNLAIIPFDEPQRGRLASQFRTAWVWWVP